MMHQGLRLLSGDSFRITKGSTFVVITVTGFSGTDVGTEKAMDTMGGFSFLLAIIKAYLEHGIILTLVADHLPKGTEKYL